ncbi:MAG: VTT domain-containing protein [Acidobacteriota bacterium]|nr:VTT domain-containing protein [Acidobacteriota bacterium]
MPADSASRGFWLTSWLHDLLLWVESFAAAPHATGALAAISFAESSVFPIPPDPLLIALCLAQPQKAFYFAAVCSISSVVGGMLGYGLGYAGGRPLLMRLFNAERVRRVEQYYDRYNAWATGIAGLTPLPYKLFTVSGGAFAINFKVFVLASVISRSMRFFAVAGIIYLVGEDAKHFIDEYLGWLTIAFVILLVAGFWLTGRAARKASRGAEPAATGVEE